MPNFYAMWMCKINDKQHSFDSSLFNINNCLVMCVHLFSISVKAVWLWILKGLISNMLTSASTLSPQQLHLDPKGSFYCSKRFYWFFLFFQSCFNFVDVLFSFAKKAIQITHIQFLYECGFGRHFVQTKRNKNHDKATPKSTYIYIYMQWHRNQST